MTHSTSRQEGFDVRLRLAGSYLWKLIDKCHSPLPSPESAVWLLGVARLADFGPLAAYTALPMALQLAVFQKASTGIKCGWIRRLDWIVNRLHVAVAGSEPPRRAGSLNIRNPRVPIFKPLLQGEFDPKLFLAFLRLIDCTFSNRLLRRNNTIGFELMTSSVSKPLYLILSITYKALETAKRRLNTPKAII